jgi:hypothetical protein
MPSERIHLPIVAAMLVAGSTVLALAQTGASGTGGTSGSPAGTTGGASTGSSTAPTNPSPPSTSAAPNPGQPTHPSAVDTTGTGGSRPGCGPSPGNPSAATGGTPPDATIGMRTPRIINDPTVGTSQTAETGLKPDTIIPKDPKTGRPGDC